MTKQSIEDEITNIFITIDNYGTAEEARVDIRALIHKELLKARIDELERLYRVAERGNYYAEEISDRTQQLKATLSADSNKEDTE